jgi:hypothetical protein
MPDEAAPTETHSTEPPPATSGSFEAGDGAFAERPELFVGAAFVGGLALALILRRFGR